MTSGNIPFYFELHGQKLQLLPQKAIFWENKQALLLADIHLGKVAHFRKEGVTIPHTVAHKDYQVLDELLQLYPVQKIIILGDLFHSTHNGAWEDFSQWLMKHVHIQVILIKGNHDILPDILYHLNNIEIHNDYLIEHPFMFSHVPIEKENHLYNLAGHIHPAVKLVGKGKQSIILPCFYFGKNKGILPAFGNFTGKASILTKAGDNIFIVVNNRVIPVSN